MFISAAPPPLKELRMIRLILSAEDALLLSPLSRLESLKLDNCFLHPAFLAALSPRAGDHPDAWTAPKLSSICLNSCAFGTETLAEVVEKPLAIPLCQTRIMHHIILVSVRFHSHNVGSLELTRTH